MTYEEIKDAARWVGAKGRPHPLPMTHSFVTMLLLPHETIDNGIREDNLIATRLVPSMGARQGHPTKVGPL